jgi:hypothetical protein
MAASNETLMLHDSHIFSLKESAPLIYVYLCIQFPPFHLPIRPPGILKNEIVY